MLSSTSPTASAGLPPPSPKPHPLQAAPHPPQPPSHLLKGPGGVQGATAGHSPLWMDQQSSNNTRPSLGPSGPGRRRRHQGGAGAGLCPQWRPAEGESTRERRNQLAGPFPGDSTARKQEWEQKQDPGHEGGQGSPRTSVSWASEAGGPHRKQTALGNVGCGQELPTVSGASQGPGDTAPQPHTPLLGGGGYLNPAFSSLMCTKGPVVGREKGAIVRTEQNTPLSFKGLQLGPQSFRGCRARAPCPHL